MLGSEHSSAQTCSSSELALTLTKLVSETLESLPSGSTVIQTGHYSLGVYHGFFNLGVSSGMICDVFSERTCPDDSANLAAISLAGLSLETWAAVCCLNRYGNRSLLDQYQVKLMTLVNDWQRIQVKANSRREQERGCNRLRSEYYGLVPRLPDELRDVMLNNCMNQKHILKHDPSCWLFSEHQLRIRFNRTLSQMMRDSGKSAELGLSSELTAKIEPIIYGSTDDDTKYQLSFCGNSGCCGEVIQLLSDLQQLGVRNFINLYPMECRNHVTAASTLARRMFGLSGMTITNIAITPLNNQTVRILADQSFSD
jgi:hypothetical protein